MSEEERCESRSPIWKFDVGPRRCRLDKGHKGQHAARTPDGADVDVRFDYWETWSDPRAYGEKER